MDKKLRILQAIDEFLPNINTSIRAIDNYTKNLNDKAEVIVAALSDKEDVFQYLPYNVVYSKSKSQLINKLLALDFDILHVHSIGIMSDIILKLKKQKRIPAVISVHKNYIDIINNNNSSLSAKIKIKKLIKKLNAFDEVFVPSPYVAQDLRKYGLTSMVSYMPLASDLNVNKDLTQLKRQANKEYDLTQQDLVLVSVCNLNKFKRLDFALEALSLVKKQGVDFKYFIIGKGSEFDNLKQLTKDLHLTNNVTFTGYMEDEDMAKLVARANLMLFPTTSDIFGLCKVESAGLDTAGVFIKNSYVAHDIFDGINGFTSHNTSQDFANKIVEALKDKNRLFEIGQNANKELYVDWDTCTKILFERTQGILSENKAVAKIKNKN